MLIRTAVVRRPDLGYILACDPDLEREDVDHAITLRWRAGAFDQARARFSAHSCCVIHDPEFALVKVSPSGIYSAQSRGAMTTGNIFRDSEPIRKEDRFGDIRSVAAVAQKAYAVGFDGIAYRLDKLSRWTRIDEGLPRDCDLQAIHGISHTKIYAVGFEGSVWRFDGQVWTQLNVPTNATLTSVHCVDEQISYIAGHGGILIRGDGDLWSVVEHGETSDDIWDLEWFEGELYVSTMAGVYRLNEEKLERVDFGMDPPKTTYHLSAASGVLWSIGRRDVLSFDGRNWTRIV
jgi:hypothetical protein